MNGGLSVGSNGLVAYLGVTLQAGFGGGVGLSFSATAHMAINTTGASQTVGSVTVDPGFLLHIDGTVTFLGFASASGFVDLQVTPTGFQMQFAIHFNLGGLNFDANGGASIQSDGMALSLQVHATADAAVFSIDASGTLQLNTSGRTLIGVSPHSFTLDLQGHIELLKVLKLDAHLTFVVGKLHAGGRHRRGCLVLQRVRRRDFFGLATLSGSVFLNSQGSFDLRLSGHMQIGSSSFGISGNFSVHVSSQFYANGDSGCSYIDGCYAFLLEGSASVSMHAFGISLAGLGIGFSFGFDTRTMGNDGRVPITLSVHVHVSFLFFSINATAHFTIGYLQFPPPIYLAGEQNHQQSWSSSGGDLYLNVGSRAQYRNIATDQKNELVTITQVSSDNTGATIQVSAFGRSQTFAHVPAASTPTSATARTPSLSRPR